MQMRLTLKRVPAPALATKLAAGAFLFFLVKGLAWLALPAVLALWVAK